MVTTVIAGKLSNFSHREIAYNLQNIKQQNLMATNTAMVQSSKLYKASMVNQARC